MNKKQTAKSSVVTGEIVLEPKAVAELHRSLELTPSTPLPASVRAEMLPPIIVGHTTPAVQSKVAGFYLSIADIFELWISKRRSQNTRHPLADGLFASVGLLADSLSLARSRSCLRARGLRSPFS